MRLKNNPLIYKPYPMEEGDAIDTRVGAKNISPCFFFRDVAAKAGEFILNFSLTAFRLYPVKSAKRVAKQHLTG